MTRILLSMLALSGALGAAADALGRIKLVTLPVRERVEIQLDHERATLVEEERIVPLVQGLNQVDFSEHRHRPGDDRVPRRRRGRQGA